MLRGARLALPLGLGSFAFGLVFGVVARQTGLSLAEATLMSALVFAGASQFVALSLWATPVPILTIALAVFVLNSRHLLMGATLRPYFRQLTRLEAYGSFAFLTDANWPIQLHALMRGEREAGILIGSGLLLVSTWIPATAIGHGLGSALGDPRTFGLDFVLVAFFIAILARMWRGRSDLLPWGTAGGVAVVADALLPGAWHIVLGGLAGSTVGALRDGR